MSHRFGERICARRFISVLLCCGSVALVRGKHDALSRRTVTGDAAMRGRLPRKPQSFFTLYRAANWAVCRDRGERLSTAFVSTGQRTTLICRFEAMSFEAALPSWFTSGDKKCFTLSMSHSRV